MKDKVAKVTSWLLVIGVVSCSEIGPDVHHRLNSSKKYAFEENDILTYASDASIEKFQVIKIVDGEYSDSRSGTCGKPRFDIYAYQAVHLKSIDSVRTDLRTIPPALDDCGYFPTLKSTSSELISSLNTAYIPARNDQIRWMNELIAAVESKTNYYESITLRGQIFKNDYEYSVQNGKRLSKLYYTRPFGFVAFKLLDGTLFTLQM